MKLQGSNNTGEGGSSSTNSTSSEALFNRLRKKQEVGVASREVVGKGGYVASEEGRHGFGGRGKLDIRTREEELKDQPILDLSTLAAARDGLPLSGK